MKADLRKESMQERWRDLSGERVHGVKARALRTSKEYRKDAAAGLQG